MAGTIIVSSIKTDTDNSFIVRSNTGATLFSVDTTSISIPDGSITSAMIANGTVIAADVADGSITDAKIAAVANTKISGLITAGQIANVANTQITGNITQAQIATGVAGTGPAFRAYRNGNQTISAATTTKVAFNAETFDTNSNFDSTTNFRFTPTVAGYYQVNGVVGFTTGAGQAVIFKNGATYATGLEVTYNASLGGHIPIADLVYLNGSTDYIELYVYLTTGTTISSGDTNTIFSGSMVRSA